MNAAEHKAEAERLISVVLNSETPRPQALRLAQVHATLATAPSSLNDMVRVCREEVAREKARALNEVLGGGPAVRAYGRADRLAVVAAMHHAYCPDGGDAPCGQRAVSHVDAWADRAVAWASATLAGHDVDPSRAVTFR